MCIHDSEFRDWGKSPFVGKGDAKQMESKKPKIQNTCPFPKYRGEFHVWSRTSITSYKVMTCNTRPQFKP